MEICTHSWTGRVNIIKMSTVPKAIYRFNAIPIKIPMSFFTELEQIILKFVWSTKDPNSQSNLKKEETLSEEAIGITLHDFKAIVYKTI